MNKYKYVLFTGSREIDLEKATDIVRKILFKYNPTDTVIVVGDANGVDKIVSKLSMEMGFITFVCFTKGAWKTFGRGGGFMRNTAMVDIVDEGYVIWNGKSKGTLDTKKKLDRKNKTKKVFTIT